MKYTVNCRGARISKGRSMTDDEKELRRIDQWNALFEILGFLIFAAIIFSLIALLIRWNL